MKNIYKGILLLGGGYLLYRVLHKNPQGVIVNDAYVDAFNLRQTVKTITFSNIKFADKYKRNVRADVTIDFGGGKIETYPNQNTAQIRQDIILAHNDGAEIVFDGEDLMYLLQV